MSGLPEESRGCFDCLLQYPISANQAEWKPDFLEPEGKILKTWYIGITFRYSEIKPSEHLNSGINRVSLCYEVISP